MAYEACWFYILGSILVLSVGFWFCEKPSISRAAAAAAASIRVS